MSSIRAVLRAAGARSANRRVRMICASARRRRGGRGDRGRRGHKARARTRRAPPAASPAEAAPEPSPLRVAAAERYKAVAAREREEGKREFANRETWKVKNVEDSGQHFRIRPITSTRRASSPRSTRSARRRCSRAPIIRWEISSGCSNGWGCGPMATPARGAASLRARVPHRTWRGRASTTSSSPARRTSRNAAVSWAAEWADWRQSIPRRGGPEGRTVRPARPVRLDPRRLAGGRNAEQRYARRGGQARARSGGGGQPLGQGQRRRDHRDAPGFWAAPNAGATAWRRPSNRSAMRCTS